MDKLYYEHKKKEFTNLYWRSGHKNVLIPNGVRTEMSMLLKVRALLKIINHPGKIIDLGCGNGLLLNHLVSKSKYSLIPYGVDFLDKSILQAKESVLPEFSNNFIVSNIMEYKFNEKFDFIITSPTYVHHKDLEPYFKKLFNALNTGGKLIFQMPIDEWSSIKANPKSFELIKSLGFRMFKNKTRVRGYLNFYAVIEKP